MSENSRSHPDRRYHNNPTAGRTSLDSVKCEVCAEEISRSPIGVRQHLKKHIRDKDLSKEDERTMSRRMSPELDNSLRNNGL